MDRRKFMKWLGLAPAIPVAATAAEKFGQTAKRIDLVGAGLVGPKVAWTPVSAELARYTKFTAVSTMVECTPGIGASGRIEWERR